MKKYLLIATAAFAFISCNQEELERVQLEKANQKDSLVSIVNQREASITEFMASFNEVEKNLDSVLAKQHILSLSTNQQGDIKAGQKNKINEGIAAINDLMNQNRKKLADLKYKLKKSSFKNVELEKAIATLTNQLAQKDVELAALNERLNNLNIEVADLQGSVSNLTRLNNEKSEALARETISKHTAYYVIGNSKELKESQLIEQKGGVLGIGKTTKLNSNIDNSKFTQIDYTQTTSIPINSNMKIITTHPADSYVLEKDEKDKKEIQNLMITNPEKFWSASKYLVVLKN